MNFLYPFFLFASLLIAVPIIIHLFNFRKYKKVFFSDIRFLKEIKEQTNRQSQLKHLLILLSRILAILALVFAFTQPYLKKFGEQTKGNKAKCIFIDNSFSMALQKNNIPLLEIAKGKAKEIVNGSSNADKFQIISNNFSPNENKWLDKEEAIATINNLTIGVQSRDISTILQKQNAILASSTILQKQIIYLSDFQKNNTSLPVKSTDQNRKFFIPVQSDNKANIAIDTCYFDTPNLEINVANTLNVKLQNFDMVKSKATTLSVNVNGQVKTVRNIEIPANEMVIEKIPYTATQAGWQNIQLSITDYPINFDDTFYVSANVNANFSILLLNENSSNPYINAVYHTAKSFRVDNAYIANVNSANFSNYSLIVLNDVNTILPNIATALENYIRQGGSVLLFPSMQINAESYNAFLSKSAACVFNKLDDVKQNITSVNKDNELVKDIFEKIPENVELPNATKHYPIQAGTFSGQQKIFSFANGDAFLSSFKIDAGKLYLCASSADATISNFATTYWFLPMMFKMAYLGGNAPINSFELDKEASINITNNSAGNNTIYHLMANGFDAIPEQRNEGNKVKINCNNATQQAGIYSIGILQNKIDAYTGLNYNRNESNLNTWQIKELKEKSNIPNATFIENNENTTANISEMLQGYPIWKICLWLCLFALLVEVLLIKFWK